MMVWCRVMVALVFMTGSAVANDVETLLIRDVAKGEFRPGLATSFKVRDEVVTLMVPQELVRQELVDTLKGNLPGARVILGDGDLKISGIATQVVMARLAEIKIVLSEEPDLLGTLALMEGDLLAMTKPEGGGSIRAGKPVVALTEGGGELSEPATQSEGTERITAVVVGRTPHGFPHVSLKLRIEQGAQGALSKGSVVKGRVLYPKAGDGVDYASPVTQQNLAAYYLGVGDRVRAHVQKGGDGSLQINWLKRIRGPGSTKQGPQ